MRNACRIAVLCLLESAAGCGGPTGRASRVTAPSASQSWSFDGGASGQPTAGWENVSGTWQTAAEPTAPSPPNVLAQVAKEHSGSYFNLAVARQPALQDVTVTLRYRAVSGTEDQGGGPVWRYQDRENYYIARENPLEGNYRVYKVVKGRRIQLGSAEIKAPAGEWHTLEVTMIGNRLECSLNGKKHLDLQDDTFKNAGRVGLWTKADAQTRFDDVKVKGN